MSFVERVIGTIKNPKSAMEGIAEHPMIEEAVIIVGVYAVLSAISGLVMADKITYVFEGMEDMPSSIESITRVSSLVAPLIGAFILWIVVTGILHLVSLALGGEGKFYPQMMTVVGFSMIPFIFGGIIGILLISMVEPITVTISATNPWAAKDALNNPYLTASSVFGTLMQFWAAAIIFFGVKNAHRLSPGKSAIVAGIPVVIAIISLVWGSGIV
ncbi:MAG: Yip1 domain protein [Candidatus Argoarchaeum ethanivorans]|uniref:Yip1 domain protein n=1 Tax=Candidatus Argoarchaeum ethanivorans TaxID=2608793 RepID=A0A811T8W4_9EURY|nr:MAG: Yip1 domain protein [Candidatus Argoarchaeum ethanivorans]